MIHSECFQQSLAAVYGTTIPDLYLQVTGEPIWADGPNATADKKWTAFLRTCAAAATEVSA